VSSAVVFALLAAVTAPPRVSGAAGPLSAVDDAGPSTQAQITTLGEIKGVTVSTPRGSSEWGSDEMVDTLGDLETLGANWVAIHPYARIEKDGTVRWNRRDGAPASEAPVWLRRPIEESHRRGLRILIKPHLAYWGNYAWRGDISFDSPEQWERFFSTYQEWIAEIARFSHDADAFVVGTELDGTIEHLEPWRQIIAAVREEYSGPLTYAANWDAFDRVEFWNDLDMIGIQAYFPLLPEPGAGEVTQPAASELDRAWAQIMHRVREYSHAVGRPVLFTELGYNNSWRAPYEPWDPEVGGHNAEAVQELCMRAALRAIDLEPSVVGAFLWKWFPGTRAPRNFAMSTIAMRRVISQEWLGGSGSSH
jgi:hypothetical protein